MTIAEVYLINSVLISVVDTPPERGGWGDGTWRDHPHGQQLCWNHYNQKEGYAPFKKTPISRNESEFFLIHEFELLNPYDVGSANAKAIY